MTDRDLSDLLDRLGERAPVGAPPTAAMLTAAARSRRRRTTWLALGSTSAVLAATISGAAMLNSFSERDRPERAPAEPTTTQAVTPAGTRLVGIGHAAIAVPDGWGTNDVGCGTPMKDTVIIDQGVVCAAYYGRPKGVESIDVYPGWYPGFGERTGVPTDSFEIDGEPAERIANACQPAYNEATGFCRGAVYLPDADVTFLAESSSQAPEGKVDEMLSWIRVVPDLVAVPGFQRSNYDWDDQDISSGEHYRSELEKLGLVVEVVAQPDPVRDEGYVLGVEPPPGEMLAPGSVVTLVAVAPRGSR